MMAAETAAQPYLLAALDNVQTKAALTLSQHPQQRQLERIGRDLDRIARWMDEI